MANEEKVQPTDIRGTIRRGLLDYADIDHRGGAVVRDEDGFIHGKGHAWIHNFLPPERVGGSGGSMWNPEFNQDFDFDAYDDIYSEEFYDDYMAPYWEEVNNKEYEDLMNKAGWVH